VLATATAAPISSHVSSSMRTARLGVDGLFGLVEAPGEEIWRQLGRYLTSGDCRPEPASHWRWLALRAGPAVTTSTDSGYVGTGQVLWCL
jgi:hypothetical protein